jgi:hypothetical protein
MTWANGNSFASGSQEVPVRLPWIFRPAINRPGV